MPIVSRWAQPVRDRHKPEMTMKVVRPPILLLMALLSAAALAPRGPVARAAEAAEGAVPSASSVPDFSGVWYRWLRPGLGPPASGPGPVTNRSRRNGVSNYNELVGDYTNPILTRAAADIVKKHGDLSLSGVGYPTPSNQCWPGGVPYVLWTFGMQMLQQKDKVTLLYLQDHEFRQVRLNQPHPVHVTPSWYGDSVGHYEGNALVIDTVGVKLGPFSMVDMYGTPFSPALHVVERYEVVAYETAKPDFERDAKINQTYPPGINALDPDPSYRGKILRLNVTVEDSGVFTTPWSAVITYGRPRGEWAENVCAENVNKYNTEHDPAVPKAGKPDF
jgi:hypothetical protein